MLTTSDLIARMTPKAFAEMIASIEQGGSLDAKERQTVAALWDQLLRLVSDEEADGLLADAM